MSSLLPNCHGKWWCGLLCFNREEMDSCGSFSVRCASPPDEGTARLTKAATITLDENGEPIDRNSSQHSILSQPHRQRGSHVDSSCSTALATSKLKMSAVDKPWDMTGFTGQLSSGSAGKLLSTSLRQKSKKDTPGGEVKMPAAAGIMWCQITLAATLPLPTEALLVDVASKSWWICTVWCGRYLLHWSNSVFIFFSLSLSLSLSLLLWWHVWPHWSYARKKCLSCRPFVCESLYSSYSVMLYDLSWSVLVCCFPVRAFVRVCFVAFGCLPFCLSLISHKLFMRGNNTLCRFGVRATRVLTWHFLILSQFTNSSISIVLM